MRIFNFKVESGEIFLKSHYWGEHTGMLVHYLIS